jgi:hypothetical protein
MKPKIITYIFFICLLWSQAHGASPDIEYRSFTGRVNSMLIDGELESLNSLAEKIRTNKTRFKDGRWKLTAFYEGMHPISSRSPDSVWNVHEAMLKRWCDQRDNISPTPYVALASFYEARAWKHRGAGYSNTVTKAGWKGWYENLSLARKILIESASVGKMCPHWYNVMQKIALGESWNEEKYEKLFKDAISNEPTYYFYYFSKANFYQSRWYGNKEKLMKFVDESVAATYEEEGYTLYARIYWSAEREFGRHMFHPGNVDWSKMKAGFNFINNKYPDSIWNLNAYAHFACRAGDKEATADALEKIAHEVNLGAWASKREYEHCKDWALRERP